MATGGNSSSLTSANQPTKLDESKDSLSLLSIIRAFDGPVTEERVWAILYQSAKTALQCFKSANPPRTTSRHNNNDIQSHQQHANNNIHNLTDKSENEVMKCVVGETLSHLLIHSDGHVHPHSFQVAADSIEAEGRTVAKRQSQFLVGLGVAIYLAVSYGLAAEEFPNLSDDLEEMFYSLLSADEGSDEGEGLSLDEGQSLGLNDGFVEDEGIEQDFGEAEDTAAAAAAASVSSTSTTSSSSASPAAAAAAAASAMTSLSQVMDRCRMHFSSTASSDQADAHFQEICRKLVAETLEFSKDLVKISSAPPEAGLTEQNHLANWAENMKPVIRQLSEKLRNGVKLKSASEWKQLKPLDPHVPCLHELLMESIRQHDSLEMKRKRCLLVLRTALKERKKLALEINKLNQHFETAKLQLELKFAEEKKELEEKVARGQMEKIELQRKKKDFEQRMLVRLQEFRDECEKKKIELEDTVKRSYKEIQHLIKKKNVLQGQWDEERRLREETMNELARIERTLGQELEEARRTNGRRRSASVPEPAIALDAVPVPHAGIFQAAEPPDTPPSISRQTVPPNAPPRPPRPSTFRGTLNRFKEQT